MDSKKGLCSWGPLKWAPNHFYSSAWSWGFLGLTVLKTFTCSLKARDCSCSKKKELNQKNKGKKGKNIFIEHEKQHQSLKGSRSKRTAQAIEEPENCKTNSNRKANWWASKWIEIRKGGGLKRSKSESWKWESVFCCFHLQLIFIIISAVSNNTIHSKGSTNSKWLYKNWVFDWHDWHACDNCSIRLVRHAQKSTLKTMKIMLSVRIQ